MKVLFVALGDVTEACSRVRIFQHLPFLESHGVEAVVVPFYPRAATPGRRRAPAAARRAAGLLHEARQTLRVSRLARRHDVVFLQRVLLRPSWQRLLARRCRTLMFDFDDAIYTTHARATSVVPAAEARFAHMLELCDAAVTSTPHLTARARACAQRVFEIRSAVDCDRYRPRSSPAGGGVTIGWIGRDSTTMYVEPLLPVFRRLARARPEVSFRLVGALPGTGEGIAQNYPWSLETELDHLARFDVGVMPLGDDEWARGKAGYKLLQYLACGIPAVASPVGTNREIVRHGETGFLAADDRDWEEHLSRLVADAALRASMGRAGRQLVEREFSLRVWAPRLLDAISETASSCP